MTSSLTKFSIQDVGQTFNSKAILGGEWHTQEWLCLGQCCLILCTKAATQRLVQEPSETNLNIVSFNIQRLQHQLIRHQ